MTPSFGEKVKQSAPYRKILQQVKITYEVLRKIILKAEFNISFSKLLLLCY
jgi:hypothetical protein